MEMRIINFAIHPDYFEDGQSNSKFLKGTDIAFAVVEIPYEKYRLMKPEDKNKFKRQLNIPQPSYINYQ